MQDHLQIGPFWPRTLSAHFRPSLACYDGGMNERKHLRIVRAVQRVVAAAKDLADAERALKLPRKKARREQATPSVNGIRQGQDVQEVHRD